jgi:opacity protein-like surface antigen
MKINITHLLFALSASLAALPSFAQVSWYGIAAGGVARTDINAVRNREETLINISSLNTDFDDTDAAWKLTAGLRINRALALELSYVDLGKATTATRGLGGEPALPFGFIVGRKVTGLGLDLVGSVPVIPRYLDVIGKVGVYRTTLKADATLEGNIVFSNNPGDTHRSAERKEDTTHLGIGLQHAITPRWSVRAEYERFFSIGKPFQIGGVGTTGEADIDVAWIGIVGNF